MFRVDILATSTTTWLLAVAKFGAPTTTEYSPGISPTTVNSPVEEVLVSDPTPVEMLVIVTCAFATAAPDESVTVPLIPFVTCALSIGLDSSRSTNIEDPITAERERFLLR